jgi:hypothetical protein
MIARMEMCKLAMAATAVALLALAGCQAMRTRTFAADRAGAVDAIQTALRQEHATAITFNIEAETASSPETAWRHPVYARDKTIRGVVAINQNRSLPSEARWRSFAASREGLAHAQAFATQAGATWETLVRLDVDASERTASHAWGWVSGWMDETVPFDAGVCFSGTCLAYEDVRTVRAVVFDEQSLPYPVSREGFEAALRDPLMFRRNAHLAVEVRRPARAARREANLYDVSVLEDGRICGTASEYPLPAIERCYAYGEVAGGLRVSDRTSTLGEALADTATFPFRLVGAAASSAGIGGH